MTAGAIFMGGGLLSAYDVTAFPIDIKRGDCSPRFIMA